MITAEEMADHLRVSLTTVYRECRARRWPHVKVARQIRFTPEQTAEIEALLTVGPATKPARVVSLADARKRIA